MLKYIISYLDIKLISTFTAVLIQQRYTNELYHIHKKLF